MMANFPNNHTGMIKLPYLKCLPEEVHFGVDGKILNHEKFGEGYIIIFYFKVTVEESV
jgi:hypothetical protein